MTKSEQSEPPAQSEPVPSAAYQKGFVEGMRDCLPVVLGYIAVGFAFGVVARTSGLSVAEIGLMSLLLYAGSAQFVVTGFLAAAAPPPAIIVTVFLVNLRHLLYSAALAPYVRRFHLWQNALIGAELTDETFAVASGHLAQETHAGPGWFFGINVTAQAIWVAATVLGALLGQLVPDTRGLGLDFALASMFAALLAGQMKSRPKIRPAAVVALVSAAVAVGGALLVPPSWAIIAAALVATTLGPLLEGRGKKWK